MRAYSAATLTDLHTKVCNKLVMATADDLDCVSSVDIQIHDVLMKADSMVWDWDIKSLWLTKARWTAMVKQYIDPQRLQAWLDLITAKIGQKSRGIAMMRSNDISQRGGEDHPKKTRQWGSCMMSFSYKVLPQPTLTMHSRTSYLGYIGVLDLTVAWNLARYIAEATGINVEDIQFIWYNEAVQWHYFKSLAFLFHHPDPKLQANYRNLLAAEELLPTQQKWVDDHPALLGGRRWLQKLLQEDRDGKDYGFTTYNTYRRIRRRYHTEVLGLEYAEQFVGWYYPKRAGAEPRWMDTYPVLPSVSVTELDFSPIRMPFGREYGVAFEGELEDGDDDE